ncbi:MAG: VWA domain-containing protein, partial [Planctomycetaceae bacterium]|nr:VWA domain-containing protein [Planctomycetaceae bacterium]
MKTNKQDSNFNNSICENLRISNQMLNIFLLVFFVLVISLFWISPMRGDESVASYDFYTSPDKTGYAALGIRANSAPSNAVHEIVFLVDTSASQTGQVRTDTLDTLKTTIANLPENSRIRILTMDVETAPITPKFVSKDSAELKVALDELKRRVPLGATDMQKGIEAARKSFDQNQINTTGVKRAVVYFGDGRSMAKTVDVPVFRNEVDNYVDQRIPFTACTVSPTSSFEIVAAFANRTGGNLVNFSTNVQKEWQKARGEANDKKLDSVDLPDFSAIAGKQILDSITANVVWVDPSSYAFPDNWEVFPTTLQPIRSDRETFVFARTTESDLKPFNLSLSGETADGKVDLSWNVVPNPNQITKDGKLVVKGKHFLAGLVESAARNDGSTLPITDRESLNNLQNLFLENIDLQLDKAKASLETGNPKQAMPILANVLKLDPGNSTAVRYLEVANHDAANNTVTYAGDSTPDETPIGEENTTAAPTKRPPLPAMVDTSIIERSISTQKLQNEVGAVIAEANRTMAIDPVGTEQKLRLMMTSIRENTSLAPNYRNNFLDRLGNTLRQTQHEKFVDDKRVRRTQENLYTEKVKLESLDALAEQDARAIQIFNRFNALMNAAEYKTAVTVAESAMEMLP